MDAAMAIAASGMAAAVASFTASASNIVNMQTIGAIPAGGPGQPASQTPGAPYQPVIATSQSSPGGGVTMALSSVLPSFSLAYDPSAPFANLQGMVAAPNVDPVAEAVNQISASEAFRANLAVFETANKDFKALLDTLA
jgi:flagellar basal-body rod protein FlgC